MFLIIAPIIQAHSKILPTALDSKNEILQIYLQDSSNNTWKFAKNWRIFVFALLKDGYVPRISRLFLKRFQYGPMPSTCHLANLFRNLSILPRTL